MSLALTYNRSTQDAITLMTFPEFTPIKKNRNEASAVDDTSKAKLDTVGDFNDDGSFTANPALLLPLLGPVVPYAEKAITQAIAGLLGQADIRMNNLSTTLGDDLNVYVSGQLDNGNRITLVVGETIALDYLAASGLDLGSIIPGIDLLNGLGLSSLELILASDDISFSNPDLETVDVGRGLTLVGVLDLTASNNKIFNFIHKYTHIDSLSVQANIEPEDGLTMSGVINMDLTLIHVGVFSITEKNSTLDLGISMDMEPSIGMTNTLELTGYDPLQSGEPTLTLTGGFSFEPESVTLFAALDTGGLSAWQDPFGFKGAQIRAAGFQVGATYIEPFVDNMGMIASFKWDQYDIDFAGSVDVNDPERLAFSLTINQDINIVRMMAQMESMALGPEASRLFNLTKSLFNYIPLTARSFDSNNDGDLDPFISFVPFPTEIAGISLEEGISINARVNLAGQVGELALASSTDFSEMSGSLYIENLVLGNGLVISGLQAGTDLTASFEISPSNLYFQGDGKISVFGQTLAQASFSLSPNQIAVTDTILPLAGPLVSLRIDTLNASLDSLSANGQARLTMLGREAGNLTFTMDSQRINMAGNFDLGALDINGTMVWDNAQDTLNISGNLSINNVNLASTQVTYDAGVLNISGKIGVSIPTIGTVDALITANYTSNSFAITAKADLGVLGSPRISLSANEFSASTLATKLYNQAAADVGAVPEYIGSTIGDGLSDVFRAGSYAFSASQVDNQIKNAINKMGGVLKSMFGGKGEHNKTYVDSQGISANWEGNGGNDVAVGNAGNDNLKAHQGNDLLDGGAGNDYLQGGQNSDVLYGGDGNDTLEGQAGGDFIYGGLGADSIDGSGSDFGKGSNYKDKDDEIHGGPGNDILYGAEGSDAVWGDGGNDLLWGDRIDRVDNAVDTVYGGAGDDIYYLMSATGPDVLVEYPDEGVDSVYSTITFTLPNNIENLYLVGAGMINGTGNGLDNVLSGNSGRNVLTGSLGDDAYFVQAADTVVETANAGNDTVYSTESFLLPANVENLTLTGAAATSATGNAADNILRGDSNPAANALAGGTGNDTYWVSALDTVVEAINAGMDTVYSAAGYSLFKAANVENLILTGFASGTLTGNSLANALTGNSGANILNGDTGSDTLMGGAGNDVFQLFATDFSTYDTLADFSTVDDVIQLPITSFPRLNTGILSGDYLAVGSAAVDGNDYLVYNSGNGDLWYDTDGNGVQSAVKIAVLPVGLALTHQDFSIVN